MELGDDEIVIRDRFDAMLLHFGHIEHYVTIELIVASDIMSPLEYYAGRCAVRGARGSNINLWSDFGREARSRVPSPVSRLCRTI